MLEQLDVQKVRIELPFRLNHVNCFLAEGEHGWTVIDAGLHNDVTKKCWQQVLTDKKVTSLLITHYHPDHFGYAGQLQKETGANVLMSAVEAKKGLRSWEREHLEKINRSYKRCGIPNSLGGDLVKNTENFLPAVTPYPTVNHYLAEGDTIVFGKYEYEVIFAPGHSDQLITLYNKEKNVLFATDHILPTITPNISYWFDGDPNPLATYLKSLDKIKQLNVEYVIPSHGEPFYDANKRIEEIKKHHEERIAETFDIIKNRKSVYEACAQLFKKELTKHELRFAIGETLSHLEYLVDKGKCIKEIDNNCWYFQQK